MFEKAHEGMNPSSQGAWMIFVLRDQPRQLKMAVHYRQAKTWYPYASFGQKLTLSYSLTKNSHSLLTSMVSTSQSLKAMEVKAG